MRGVIGRGVIGRGVIGTGEAARAPGIDVVFIAPDEARGDAPAQRTVAFAPGEPIPRVGECVIIALGGAPARWQVRDVAHVFEDEGHGIAIRLGPPAP